MADKVKLYMFTGSTPSLTARLMLDHTVLVRTGTGAFSHIRGTGTIACTTTDGGAHKTCTVKTKLRGI